MESKLIIGHYSRNGYTSDDETLKELNVSNFLSVVEETEVCPHKPTDRDYKQWKTINLHLLFFTNTDKRPCKNNPYSPSGFASIDIDHKPDTNITSTHPSVWGINKTPNGTHIIVFGVFGRTLVDWQHSYLCIAFEVLQELKAKYGSDIRLDGTCAKHKQGCFLWNSKWDFSNPNLDLTYRAANRAFGDEDIDEMFEKKLVGGKWVQSFSWEDDNTAYNPAAKTAKERHKTEHGNQNDTAALNLCTEHGIDKEMRNDLFTLTREEWLRKYERMYSFVYEAPTNYEWVWNYRGDWVKMAVLDGNHARLWIPIWRRGGETVGHKIPRGHRRRKTYQHLIALARLMDESMGGADPHQMLYNAVYWVVNFCVDGLAKSKKGNGYDVTNAEILCCVVDAIEKYKDGEEDILYRERKLYKCGDDYIDGETGEEVHLMQGDPNRKTKKIGLNSIQRKTLRIMTAVDMFDPSMSIEENCERMNDYSHLEQLTPKTLKHYIKCAKGIDIAVKQYPWLKRFEFNDKRQTSLAIEEIRSGKVMRFKTVKECLEKLKWSKPTFYKFLKGESKYNKIYTLKSENQ